jgi:hypothetical protein
LIWIIVKIKHPGGPGRFPAAKTINRSTRMKANASAGLNVQRKRDQAIEHVGHGRALRGARDSLALAFGKA